MIRYLTLEEVLELHRLALAQSGGLVGVRDLGGLDSALAKARTVDRARKDPEGGGNTYPPSA